MLKAPIINIHRKNAITYKIKSNNIPALKLVIQQNFVNIE